MRDRSVHTCRFLVLFALAVSAGLQAAELKVVGVLGNSSGLSDRPFPYAFYTGITADEGGRLYFAGSRAGIPVADQDGKCLAVLPIPDEGLFSRSVMVRVADSVFCIATDANQTRSALYRIRTSPEDAAALKLEKITAGPGTWALSPTLDQDGNLIVGRSEPAQKHYDVLAVAPATGQLTAMFSLDEPDGVRNPWKHEIQADPDGLITIYHYGGVNFDGAFALNGKREGPPRTGQIVGQFRYTYGYHGDVRRMALDGKTPAPGNCGSPAPEIRMAAQMVPVGDRYFFAGRGGAVEARWTGSEFVYTRRVGGVLIRDMAGSDGELVGAAFQSDGNFDVEHAIRIPKQQPVAQLLKVGTPFYGKSVAAVVPAPGGMVYVYKKGKAHVAYDGTAGNLAFDLELPEVKEIGQAAVLGRDMLLADPGDGVIWRRPLTDKKAPLAVWREGPKGVRAVAAVEQSVYIATAVEVMKLTADGKTIEWTCPVKYKEVRRLAATHDHVYVCDFKGHVVDQLDARSGARLARLGEDGKPGQTLDRLNGPWAVTADVNGVYIADNGNGRILVATTTLWRPEIPALPRLGGPVTAVRLPLPRLPAGRLSVNVYDTGDRTVAQLACAQPSGEPVVWDGRNLFGEWAAPGRYRFHAVIAPQFTLRYITSIGQSGTPPYRTADGKGSWGGVWGNVMDVCTVSAAPDSDIVVLWAFEEGEGGLIRMSQDGKVRWKQHLDWWMKAQQTSLTCDGQRVYIVGASAMNAPSGQAKYGGELRRPLLWRVDVDTGDHLWYPGGHEAQPMLGEYVAADVGVGTDIAARGGTLYITSPAQQTLFVVDPASGAATSALKVGPVSGVCFDPDGRLVAGVGNRLVVLDPASGAEQKVVADLRAPVWDVDAVAGGGFVATVGAPRNQVVALDAAGREVRAFGRMGGRPLCGKLQPESFLAPVGVCTTGGGKMFVAENSSPKRFTRWTLDGRFERQFDGPYYYSGMFGIDEDEPEWVYGDTHRDLIRYRVDYDSGQWSVDSYWINAYQDSGVPIKWWPRIRRRDGRIWWCSGSGGIVELHDDHVRGVAAVYGGWVEPAKEGGYTPVYHTKKTGLKGTWSDTNGDGVKQPDEWQVTDKPAYPLDAGGPQQGWGAYFDEKFNLYMHDWSDGEAGGVWMIPVSEWKGGAPVYRWDQARHVGLPLGHGLAHGASGARTAFAADGAAYAFNGGYNAAGLPGIGHGHDWEFLKITRYDAATGKPVWHAGDRAPAYAVPGQMYCPTGPSGLIGDYLFWTDENSLVHVWDNVRGLYVDTLLQDVTRNPPPSPYTVWVELFNTRVFRHPRTGKVYLLAASDAIHVFEVLGTEQTMTRFQGDFDLTAEQLASARQQWQARQVGTEPTLLIPRAERPVNLEGSLSEFDKAGQASVRLLDNAQMTARLLYDDKFLYVRFDVVDDSPWKNAGTEISTLFKTGDTASVWIGPAGKRTAPVVGDVRVLFAPMGGRNVAVAFRAKVASGARPVPFRSPSSEVRIDRVDLLPDVRIVVHKQARGYQLAAAIPRSEIGLETLPDRVALDLSTDFSDPAGERNTACLRWGRGGAAHVFDLPVEARFDPDTWGVGVFEAK